MQEEVFADKLYDAVKEIQLRYPELYSLIPISTFMSDDPLFVMLRLAEAAQDALDKKEDLYYYCDQCGSADLTEVYCYNCFMNH